MRLWWPKVSEGGRMCGDDADASGVKARLDLLRAFSRPAAQITWPGGNHWCASKPRAGESSRTQTE